MRPVAQRVAVINATGKVNVAMQQS